MNDESLISGWWVFAGVLLLIAGVLNIIYGIAAIGDSKFFTENVTYILSGLHTWGWILLIIGVLELVAAFSLFSGGEFGRWFGIFIASLNAIGALLSIPAYPFWSLAVFALAIIVIYKLAEGPEGLNRLARPLRMSAKAPGSGGLRRLGARGSSSRFQRRPGRRGALVALVEDVDAGHPVLPAAPAFVEEDPEEAEAEGDRRQDQADQPPAATGAAAGARPRAPSVMPKKRIPGVCPASVQKATR